MSTTKNPANPANAAEIGKQIQYLARAMKAPRIREAAARLGDQAREAGGRMRSTSPRSWTGRSAPATPREPGYGSALRGSGRPRQSRTSPSTTSPASTAT